MSLKFKNEAAFAAWHKTLPERPRLRVAASLGERVVVDERGARVVLTALPPTVRNFRTVGLPSRAAVELAARRALWTVIAVFAWGASLCLAALWGMHHPVV